MVFMNRFRQDYVEIWGFLFNIISIQKRIKSSVKQMHTKFLLLLHYLLNL